jgi:hypothetical protein
VVAAADIVENKDRRKRMAGAFQRAMIEVWPSVGPDEGLLDLWVADSGALETPTGPWPWLHHGGPVDFYEGVPVGVDLRGDAVIAPTDGASYLVGGRPGQGKSTLVRLLALGLGDRRTAWPYRHRIPTHHRNRDDRSRSRCRRRTRPVSAPAPRAPRPIRTPVTTSASGLAGLAGFL